MKKGKSGWTEMVIGVITLAFVALFSFLAGNIYTEGKFYREKAEYRKQLNGAYKIIKITNKGYVLSPKN